MSKNIYIVAQSDNQIGKIIIPANTKPWPHELRVARILANAGFCVEFIPEENIMTPDIYLNGTMFEIKSPKSNKSRMVEYNLSKALKKCPNVIFDSFRMKIPDHKIVNLLTKRFLLGHGIKRLIFVDKQGRIIDIGRFK